VGRSREPAWPQVPLGAIRLLQAARAARPPGPAHVGHWQGRRARYRGTHKNLFDLRRVVVVRNLHGIGRQATIGSYQLAA
jgi:hypothetical protein